jgi:hypothetical protein
VKKSEINRIRNRALLAIAITLGTGLISSGFPLPYYTRIGTGDIFSLPFNFPFVINFPFLIIDIIFWYIIICLIAVLLETIPRRL